MVAAARPARSARHILDPRSKSASDLAAGPSPHAPEGWLITYYPDAKEATATPLATRRVGAPIRHSDMSPEQRAALDVENVRRNVRRARGEARRYCRTNGLCHLWVLTYAGAGCHDWMVMVEHVEALLRALKPHGVPALVVPEWHPGGHGLHVNLALGSYLDWRIIVGAWKHGRVKTPRLKREPRRRRRRLDPGTLAGYIAGYLGRGADAESGELGKPGAVTGCNRPHGAHRYFCAHGHKPERYQDATPTLADAGAFLRRVFGRAPSHCWRSWDHPPEPGAWEVVAVWCDYWPRPPRARPK